MGISNLAAESEVGVTSYITLAFSFISGTAVVTLAWMGGRRITNQDHNRLPEADILGHVLTVRILRLKESPAEFESHAPRFPSALVLGPEAGGVSCKYSDPLCWLIWYNPAFHLTGWQLHSLSSILVWMMPCMAILLKSQK